MIYRIFGSKNCEKCNILTEAMDKLYMTWLFVDADLDENQEICDAFNVDELPHIQVLNIDGEILYEHIGYINPKRLKYITDDIVFQDNT